MAFDLDAVNEELGFVTGTDATQDAAVEKLRVRTLAEVEAYLDRKLEYVADNSIIVYRAMSPLVALPRYPVTEVLAAAAEDYAGGVTSSSSTVWYRDSGLVEDDRFTHRRVALRWAGGYSFSDTPPDGVESLPRDLETALIMLSARAWESEAGSGAALPPGIESMTIEGLGTIRKGRMDRSDVLARGLGGLLFEFAHVLDRYTGRIVG